MLDTAWPWASEAYGLCRLCAYFCAHKLTVYAQDHTALYIVLQIVASTMLQSQYSGAGYCLAFAVCAHTFCARKLIRARSYIVFHQTGIAMGFLLPIRMSCARFQKGVGAGAGVVVLGAGAERAAALVGCWCCCRCCELAKRAGAGGSWLCALWRCRKLAAQAAYILVQASRMSTDRGIPPSYLGLCWCNYECWCPDF